MRLIARLVLVAFTIYFAVILSESCTGVPDLLAKEANRFGGVDDHIRFQIRQSLIGKTERNAT
jgi:hypothetical protein